MVKKLLYINIILALVLNWFSANPNFLEYGFSYLNILPKQAFAMVEILSIIIFLSIIPTIKKRKEFAYFVLIIGAILLFYMPYTILKGGGLIHYILGIRNYFSWIPMFFGGYYLSMKNESIKPFIILILLLGFIQLPVTIFQYVFSFALISRGTVYDVVAGTMGGIAGNLLSVILTSMALVLIYGYLKYKKNWMILAVIALIIPNILAEAKGVFVLLVIGIFYMFIFGSISLNKRLKIISLGSVLLVLLVFSYLSLVDLDRNVWNPAYYIEYEMSKDNRIDGRVARHTSILIANETINNEPLGALVGVGFGNASINNVSGKDGSYYSFYYILHFWDRFLTETGYLGVFLLLMFIYKGISISKYVEKRASDKFISTLAGSMGAVLFISIFAGLYIDHFNRVQYTYPLALIMGYLTYEYKKLKNINR